MGGSQYPNFNTLAREIWQWAEKRNNFLFASYIKSSENIEADTLSRISNPDTEWCLSRRAFQIIVNTFGYPKVDLFASKHNFKVNLYVSRYPDANAQETDAFTISWSNVFFYAFPPFAMVLRTLNKIRFDKALGIMVVPDWPNQPWYPLFHCMLISQPINFKESENVLFCPSRSEKNLSIPLMVGILSGRPS